MGKEERAVRERRERGVGGWRRVVRDEEVVVGLGERNGGGALGRRRGREGRDRDKDRGRDNRSRERERERQRDREYYISVIEDEAARWPDPDGYADAASSSSSSDETDVYYLEARYPHNVVPKRKWAESFKELAGGEYGLVGPKAYWAAHLAIEALCWLAFIAFLSILCGRPFDIYNRGGGRWDVLFNAWEVVKLVFTPVVWVLKTVFTMAGGEYLVAAWAGVKEAWEYSVTAGGQPISLRGVVVDFPVYLVKVMLSRFLPWVWESLMNVWYGGGTMIGDDAVRAAQEREAWTKGRAFLWVFVVALAIVWTS